MKMLRQWNGSSNKLIAETFADFGFKDIKIGIVRFEALTPDSFIWYIGGTKVSFCLYAEDFVSSLDHVLKTMHANRPDWNCEVKYELQRVLKNVEFEKASPVTAAHTYPKPKDVKNFMKYAAPSGFDFVFSGQKYLLEHSTHAHY